MASRRAVRGGVSPMAAVLALALVLALATATTAADPASSAAPANGKHGSGKGKPPMTGSACVDATGVPGCDACSASSSHKSKSKSSFPYRCTGCTGEAYLPTPVQGICLCAGGFGRPPTSEVGAAATALSSSAHGSKGSKGSSKGGSSHGGKKGGGSTPKLPLAACEVCPEGSVSAVGLGVCSACADGYEPFLPQRVSCTPVCTPLTCADVGATCGTISDGCSSTVECGGCDGSLTCDAATNQCACPDGSVPSAGGACLTQARLTCRQGSDCKSGVCDNGVCVLGCPPLSAPDAPLELGGGCVCQPGSYNAANGKAPCTACGGDSYNFKKGSKGCACDAPRKWVAAKNDCACEEGFFWSNGACLPTGGALTTSVTCTTGSDCSSGSCPVAGEQCSLRTCADGTAPLGDQGCLCPSGYFSETGEVPVSGGCTQCGTGSTSTTTYGSKGCACYLPAGAVWDATTNTCVCPAPYTAVGTSCLLRDSETCLRGVDCASGVCRQGVCATSCGPNAAPNAVGNCACAVNTWGPGGLEPCQPCLDGSGTGGQTGQSVCTCPDGKGTWSPATGSCECPAGQAHSKTTGVCLTGNLRACTSGAECASGVCSGIVCVDECPVGSQVTADGRCLCLPNSFGPGGSPGSSGGCTACGGGSFAPLAGSSACTCSKPAGATWVPQDNACECPQGQVPSADGSACVTSNGGTCATGATCASGTCGPDGTCVNSCGAGAEAVDGACVCSAGFYSTSGNGAPPCVACGGGSTNTGTGNSVCVCAAGSGQVWTADTNACQCPVGQALGSANTCLSQDGNVCKTGADCVSGNCINSLCSSGCTPPTMLNAANTACVCRPGSFASGGSCTICVKGSTSPTAGSTSCTCSSPVGSVWQASNKCQCPAGSVAVAGFCKTSPGGACTDGASCSTGLCNGGVCINTCPTGSEPDGAGSCRCKANYFGASGRAPCTACAGGSTSAAGSDNCKCSSPATWSPQTNACTCPAGQTYGSGGCQCQATVCSTSCLTASSPTCSDPAASCVSGQCLPNKVGAKCVNSRGECGACVDNCGRDTPIICRAYGFGNTKQSCGVSASGGGGRCGGTLVCCGVRSPHIITPRADGSCQA